MTPIEKIAELCDEAQMIVSNHDGIHNLKGAISSLSGYRDQCTRGLKPNWTMIDHLIRKMRICAKTGSYPSVPEVGMRQIENYEEI